LTGSGGIPYLTLSRVDFQSRKVSPIWNSRLSFGWTSTLAYSSKHHLLLVINSEKNLSLVSAKNWSVVQAIPFAAGIACVRFIDDGQGPKLIMVFTGTQGMTFSIVDIPSLKITTVTQIVGYAGGPCAGFDDTTGDFYFLLFRGGSPNFQWELASVNVRTKIVGPQVSLMTTGYIWFGAMTPIVP